MKPKRNLSGIFYKMKNEETGEFEPIAFEDLTSQQQNEVMNGCSVEWLKSLAKQLAVTINQLGDRFNIIND